MAKEKEESERLEAEHRAMDAAVKDAIAAEEKRLAGEAKRARAEAGAGAETDFGKLMDQAEVNRHVYSAACSPAPDTLR